jgi:CRISPR/Cas system-associated protein Cas10 (large subunit of type III CRISPR-Cas system)
MDDLEFVKECELDIGARPWRDVLRICAMVRAREDDLADWRKAQANGDELGTCSVCGDFRAVDEADHETGSLICQRCQVEAFRVRLAKHEAILDEDAVE